MEKKEIELPRQLKKKRKTKDIHKPIDYNIYEVIEELKVKDSLPCETMVKIISQSIHFLKNEPNVLRVNSPFVVVGDVHGQFHDLINIFQKFGYPPKTRYLFLGDYVDRGKFCIQTMTILLVMKLLYPQSIHLLRGNHEGRVMTTSFNFKLQCQTKYPNGVYEKFIDLFINLPLCAIIDGRYFAVHGGISPLAKTIGNQVPMADDLTRINRFSQIPIQGPLCDLLWSDPLDENHDGWVNNKNRSCSFFYSRIQSSRFLNTNSLKMIIRGHEVQMKGYKYQVGVNNQPLALTIFSAPKYCDTYRNKAAVAILNGKNIVVQSFKQVQHPFVLNNYLNAFQLSFPILAASATRLFTHMLKNHKIRRSIKCSDHKSPQYDKTLEQVESLGGFFSSNVTALEKMLESTSNQMEAELQDAQGEICQSLLQLFEMNIRKGQQDDTSMKFGPRRIQFVKVQVSCVDQEDPTC